MDGDDFGFKHRRVVGSLKYIYILEGLLVQLKRNDKKRGTREGPPEPGLLPAAVASVAADGRRKRQHLSSWTKD